MVGALPTAPFQKKGNGGGGAFHNNVMGCFMVYQYRIETIYCSYSCT